MVTGVLDIPDGGDPPVLKPQEVPDSGARTFSVLRLSATEQRAEADALITAFEHVMRTNIRVVQRSSASVKSLPDRMSLGVLRDQRYRVVKPIGVKFEESEGQAIARADKFDEFGFGKSRQEALSDLQVVLVQLYDTLDEDQENLGPELQQIWERMRESVERREYQA